MEKSSALPSSPLYALTVDLLIYIYKLSSSPEDEKYTQACNIQKSFWDALNVMFVPYLEAEGEDFVMERISRFLVMFRNPMAAGKKKTKVMFAEETSPRKRSNKPASDDNVTNPLVADHTGPLQEIVGTTCKLVQEQSRDFSLTHLTFLACLFDTYISVQLLRRLQNVRSNDELSDEDLTFSYFEAVIMPRLKNCPSDGSVAHCVVDILHPVFTVAPVKTKLKILQTFYKVSFIILL